MTKLFVALSLLLVVASIGTDAFKLPKNLQVEVVSSEQMKDLLKQYPNAIEMERKVLHETANEIEANEAKIEYFWGKRVSGDFLVSHDEQTQSWDTPQDVEKSFSYPPEGGNGAVVTHVSVKVRQSTFNGKAYVISGGIGFRHIRVVIETYKTYIFDHEANFYGY